MRKFIAITALAALAACSGSDEQTEIDPELTEDIPFEDGEASGSATSIGSDAADQPGDPLENNQPDAAPVADSEWRTNPTAAQRQAAATLLATISAGVSAEDMPGEVSNAVFGCIYETPLGELSHRLTEQMAALGRDIDDPDQRLSTLAVMCGVLENTPPASPEQ